MTHNIYDNSTPQPGKPCFRTRTGTQLQLDGKWRAVVRIQYYTATGLIEHDEEYIDPTPHRNQAEALARARAAVVPKLEAFKAQHPHLTVKGMP